MKSRINKKPHAGFDVGQSKNEFELAGYLAFFTLVASDPKSIQRAGRLGREKEFVKRCRSEANRRIVILRLPEPGAAKQRNGGGRRRISSFPTCVESHWFHPEL